jgi:hypothetical protein
MASKRLIRSWWMHLLRLAEFRVPQTSTLSRRLVPA